jgi:hypothetical protein
MGRVLPTEESLLPMGGSRSSYRKSAFFPWMGGVLPTEESLLPMGGSRSSYRKRAFFPWMGRVLPTEESLLPMDGSRSSDGKSAFSAGMDPRIPFSLRRGREPSPQGGSPTDWQKRSLVAAAAVCCPMGGFNMKREWLPS